MGGMGDMGGDHGEFERIGDANGDDGGDVFGVLSGEIGSNTIGDCGGGGVDCGGGDVRGGGVDGCGGGGDDGGCACCARSSTSILRAVPKRTADLRALLLLLLTTLSLWRSSSTSVSSDVVDAGNILVSSLK